MPRWLVWLFAAALSCTGSRETPEPRNPLNKQPKPVEASAGAPLPEGGASVAPAKPVFYETDKETQPEELASRAFEVIRRYYETIGAAAPRFDGRLASAA